MNVTCGGLFANNQYVGDSARRHYAVGRVQLREQFLFGLRQRHAVGPTRCSGAGSLATSSAQYVGYSGSGLFTQSGGSDFAPALYLGFNPGSTGTYSLSGTGTLSAGYSNECIGNSGTGVFNQSGGTNSFTSGIFYLGYNASANGAYNLSGAGLLSTPTQYVGYSGSGVFTQTGGSNANAGSLYPGATRAQVAPTASRAGATRLPAASTSAPIRPRRPPTASAAPASSPRQRVHRDDLRLRGRGLLYAVRRHKHGHLPNHRHRRHYSLTGGTLQANGRHREPGRLRRRQPPASLAAGGILDLTSGTLEKSLRPLAEHGGRTRC